MLAIRKKQQTRGMSKTTAKSKRLEVVNICHKDLIPDPAAVLDMPSTTKQGILEPKLAHKLLLWRKGLSLEFPST